MEEYGGILVRGGGGRGLSGEGAACTKLGLLLTTGEGTGKKL